jgi:FkbM family methyltransferase
MKHLLLRLIPAFAIRAAGRLQFQIPLLRTLINHVGQSLAGEGVIQRGAGKGLRFDASGCNPGYLTGTSEPLEQELLLRYCRPGEVIYDLGANAGFYAMIAARAVGHKGHVYAFEPMPALALRTRENAARNSFKNVHVTEAAVSAIDGEISFGVFGLLNTNNSTRVDQAGNVITVTSIRLDTFCVDHHPPDLLLIDIEGSEIEALEGGLQVISQHRPVIMVEVHWLGQAFIDFFHRSLRPLGYAMTTYEGAPPCPNPDRWHALLIPNQFENI